VGFISLHVKTGLWKLVHADVGKLDEREVQVTLESLRRAYSIFTVISLAILLVLAVMTDHHDSMLILVFVTLLYLAHTLPSAVIAWRQKRV
jgi:hypothetical protein